MYMHTYIHTFYKKLTKLYVNDQAKHVVLPKVMGHAANKLYINK